MLDFVAYGTPAPKGSKRFVGLSKAGRGILIESCKAARPWGQSIKAAALTARGSLAPIDGPVWVTLVFTLRKPVSAPKRRRTYPCRKPDLDKLCRQALDSLVEAGVLTDDARVITLTASKVFVGEGLGTLDIPGVHIMVGAADEDDQMLQYMLER